MQIALGTADRHVEARDRGYGRVLEAWVLVLVVLGVVFAVGSCGRVVELVWERRVGWSWGEVGWGAHGGR